MTTIITLIIIAAMLWLAWPRTPRVAPRPSPENLLACRYALQVYADFLESRPRL